MKTRHRQVKTTEIALCEVCRGSIRVDGYGTQFGVLRASWGYGSRHDGEKYEVHLCELCFFRTLSGLRRERLVHTMFDGETEDLRNFGLIARDDYFNDIC